MAIEAPYTHADLAERLKLPLSTTVELRKREGWPHVRFGKAVRFTEGMIEEIIASHVVTPTSKTQSSVFEGQRPSRGRSR